MQNDTTDDAEHFGWRTFRTPPVAAMIVGAVYGAVAGAIIVWDIAVLIRLFRLGRRRVALELERRRSDGTPS
jgi:hypothetical protein